MASIEQVRREDAVAQLVNTAQGVGSLLLSLSTCDEYEERERDGFHLLALSLIDAAKAASEAEDAAQ